MEMSQIRYFIAVSETLNFTRAAEVCFISQPALTKGIKKLESSIGGELLHRTKNSVELSFLGKTLLPKFKKIYQDARQTKDEAHRLLTRKCTYIRVGIQSNIFMDELLPLLQSFKCNNNDIDFEFVESDQQHLKSKLNDREIDVAFLSSENNNFDHASHHEVHREAFVIAFDNHHHFSGRSNISFTDLHQQNFCFRSHCDSSRQLKEFLFGRGVRLNIVYNGPRDDRVKSLVQAGFGVAYLPKSEAIKEGILYTNITDYSLERSIVLQTALGGVEGDSVKDFVENLYAFLSSMACRPSTILYNQTPMA